MNAFRLVSTARRGLRPGLLFALLTLLALAGCATPYGGYPSGGYGQGSGTERVLGTVQYVDLQAGRLTLAADGSRYGGGGQMDVMFDRSTRLYYQGRQVDIAGLERGDRVSIEAVRSGGRLWARTMEVVQNVRDGGGYYGGGDLRGTVAYVDTRARLIEINQGYSRATNRVYYDGRTSVEYRGQYLRPEQLERGDVIRVQARPSGNDWLAERIWVEVDARSR